MGEDSSCYSGTLLSGHLRTSKWTLIKDFQELIYVERVFMEQLNVCSKIRGASISEMEEFHFNSTNVSGI